MSLPHIDYVACMLRQISKRKYRQTRDYPNNKFQSGKTSIAEFIIFSHFIKFERRSFSPKKVLTSLIYYLVKFLEHKVKATCYCSFSLYVQRGPFSEDNQKMYRYIDIIIKHDDPPGTALRLINESIEGMGNGTCYVRDDDGDIILNVFKSEIIPYFDDVIFGIKNFDLGIFKEDNCIVCMENKPNILFCNCGHLVICSNCFQSYNDNKCIKCRKINNIIKSIE